MSSTQEVLVTGFRHDCSEFVFFFLLLCVCVCVGVAVFVFSVHFLLLELN